MRELYIKYNGEKLKSLFGVNAYQVSFGGKLVEVIKGWKFVVWVMKRIDIFFLISLSLSLSFRFHSC